MLPERRPLVCLVTDRHRLPADPAAGWRALLAQIREAADAGVDLVQIRERDLEAGRLAALVAQAIEAVRGTTARVLVNDRLDVALTAGAHGVHLRADSVPPAAARQLTPRGFLVGRSVHGAAEAAAVAGDVDYLIAGTTFATASKPEASKLLGESGLARVVSAAGVPVLAIGGVTLDRLARVAAAGAAGFAAIGLFVAPSLPAIVAEARAAFDSVKSRP